MNGEPRITKPLKCEYSRKDRKTHKETGGNRVSVRREENFKTPLSFSETDDIPSVKKE